VGLERTEKSP